jgi:hypothetical protein
MTFYLKKITRVSECKLGDEVMCLVDFDEVVMAGSKGAISEVDMYDEDAGFGITVRWHHAKLPGGADREDRFPEGELEYLALGTERHPDPMKVDGACTALSNRAEGHSDYGT